MAYGHLGTCLCSTLTGWLLSLLALAPTAFPSAPVSLLVGNSAALAVPFSLPSAQIPTTIIWRKNTTTLAMGSLHPNFTVVIAPEYQMQLSVDPVRGDLNITAVTLSDSGVYTVEVSPLGSAVKRGNLTVLVYEQVGNVSMMPSSVAVTEGNGSVSLTCSPVRGAISWTKDGQILSENHRYLRSGGSLQISPPLRTDAGVYRCIISNPFGNGTSTARLTVYYGPETPVITISSSSAQNSGAGSFVLVNSSVNLTCLAPSQPAAEIYWNVADTQHLLVPSSPILQLPKVQLNQAGPYSCLAINQRTQRLVRNTRHLVVAQRPTGFPHCSVTSANNGTTLLFVCSWPGGSPPPHLTLQGLPGQQQEVNASILQQLLAPPLPAEINGKRVTCLGHHLTARGNCSVTPEAPSGVLLSFRTYNDGRGSVTVELHCQGTFNPADISWFRDRRPLIPASGEGHYWLSPDGTRLTIWNFTAPRDLGDYSASCSNPLGSQHANLTVVGPSITDWTLSHGPYPGSAHMAWTVPSGSVVTSFWIQMKDAKEGRSAGEWKTVEVSGPTNRSITIVGLEHQTAYSFRIVPLLGSQTGNASDTQILQPPDSRLSSGAIAGIVIGSIFGMLLIITLLILLIFCFWRAGSNRKVPPTPPETQQHYLSRQFPNGNKLEPSDPSWGNPRWSSGDSDIYAITYEKHLVKYGGPDSYAITYEKHLVKYDGPGTSAAGASNSRSPSPAGHPATRTVRSATQV